MLKRSSSLILQNPTVLLATSLIHMQSFPPVLQPHTPGGVNEFRHLVNGAAEALMKRKAGWFASFILKVDKSLFRIQREDTSQKYIKEIFKKSSLYFILPAWFYVKCPQLQPLITLLRLNITHFHMHPLILDSNLCPPNSYEVNKTDRQRLTQRLHFYMEGCRTYHSLFPEINADCCDEFGVKFTICVLIKHTGLPYSRVSQS